MSWLYESEGTTGVMIDYVGGSSGTIESSGVSFNISNELYNASELTIEMWIDDQSLNVRKFYSNIHNFFLIFTSVEFTQK